MLSKKTNRLIGQAMHDYGMLADGDRVLVAVSGGIDSLVLIWLLDYWRKKAPISYELAGLHLDMGFDDCSHLAVRAQLDRLAIPYTIDRFQPEIPPNELDGCYHCARQRRNRLFSLASEGGYSKIAFGHHKEDILETFFLNLLYGGNLSTMLPKQNLFDGKLALIRPMGYLEKAQIREIGDELGITPVPNPCPFVGNNKREEIRAWLAELYSKNPLFKGNIFAAMANIRADYLLPVEPGSGASRAKKRTTAVVRRTPDENLP